MSLLENNADFPIGKFVNFTIRLNVKKIPSSLDLSFI